MEVKLQYLDVPEIDVDRLLVAVIFKSPADLFVSVRL
jgi:hypothetical protein